MSDAKSIETYITDARKSGMADAGIKEQLLKAGWVEDQVNPILSAMTENTKHEAVESTGPKQLFSLRKLPDMFIDYVWKRIF